MKILKFYASWCMPCKVMTNLLQGYDEYPIEEVDIESPQNEELIDKYNVRGIPYTVLLDSNDEVLAQKMGKMDKAQLTAWINSSKK